MLKREETDAERQNDVPCFMRAAGGSRDGSCEKVRIFEHADDRQIEHDTEDNNRAAASPLEDPGKRPIGEDGEYQQRHPPDFPIAVKN